jgi:hypothetical protein
MALEVLTAREASIFACVTDAVVAPEPLLPPVRETDCVTFFDRWLALSPKRNAAGLRALLYAIEVSPLAAGRGKRLRQLDAHERREHLASLETVGPPQARQLAKLVAQIAFLSYYGDDNIMRRVGYDPEERLQRGRELREAEARAR